MYKISFKSGNFPLTNQYSCGKIIELQILWRGGRVAEGAALEML